MNTDLLPRLQQGWAVFIVLAFLGLVWASAPVARALGPEQTIDPVALREYPRFDSDVVELYVEVPWSGPDPVGAAILLQLPERAWTHIEFVETVRNQDRLAALFELDLLGDLWTGLEFHYQWRITDAEGVNHVTAQRSVLLVTPDKPWRVQSDPRVRVFFYGNDPDVGPAALMAVVDSMDLIERQLGLTLPRQAKIVIYPTYEDFYAILDEAPDSGLKGIWISAYELIMLQADQSDLEQNYPSQLTLHGVLAHELTHAAIDQNLRGPWGPLPTWIHEGLATWIDSQVDGGDKYDSKVAAAYRDGEIIPLRGLHGYLPIDRAGISLVYAQSYSMVNYLIDSHGAASIRRLLAAFAAGNTEDESLLAAYGFDSGTLEADWLASLAAAAIDSGSENNLLAAPVTQPDGSNPEEQRTPVSTLVLDELAEAAETILGNDELPEPDAGTRSFVAITGVSVLAILGLIGFLATRRRPPQIAVRQRAADGSPDLPARRLFIVPLQTPRPAIEGSGVARLARSHSRGFGFNRFRQLNRLRPDRFQPPRRPRLRRFGPRRR